MRRLCGVTAVAVAVVLLAGCSSSSSRRFRAFEEQFVSPGDTETLGYDDLEPGDKVELAARSFGVDYDFTVGESPDFMNPLGYEPTNLTIEIDDDDMAIITMETARQRMVVREGEWQNVIGDWGPDEESLVFAADQPGDAIGVALSRFYDYVHFGAWVHSRPTEQAYTGFFRLGLMTEPAGLPQDGTATYSEDGIVTYGQGLHMEHGPYDLVGVGLHIEVDFGTGELEGVIEDVHAAPDWMIISEAIELGDPEPWLESFNNIYLAADISEDASFAGLAEACESGDSPFSFTEGAGGIVEGEFYGPEAEELGGLWILEADNNVALGSFGAPRD